MISIFLIAVTIAASCVNAALSPATTKNVSPFADCILKRSLRNRPSFALGYADLDYFVEFSIGTPPQTIVAKLDTWSSDTWVYSGKAFGLYDPIASSTASLVDYEFTALDDSDYRVTGSHYNDTFYWNGSKFSPQFGVVNSNGVDSPTNVFGIGLTPSQDSEKNQKNILFAMRDAGIVDSVAYTLLYDPKYNSFSRLLVGSPDKGRFLGSLQTLPVVDDTNYMVEAEIYGSSVNVILDHGTVYTFLPKDLIQQYAKKVGAVYDDRTKNYWVDIIPTQELPCLFGSVKINMPPLDLWERVGDRFSLTLFSNEFSSGLNILGDNFLLSAYVVFDSEKREVSIAPMAQSTSFGEFVSTSG